MKTQQALSKKMFRVTLDAGDTGDEFAQFDCADNEKVLMAMERMGVSGIQIGCRGGGCGACRVEVVEGNYDTQVMSKKYVTEQEARDGFALACRVLPKSDLILKAAPRSERDTETQAPQVRAASS